MIQRTDHETGSRLAEQLERGMAFSRRPACPESFANVLQTSAAQVARPELTTPQPAAAASTAATTAVTNAGAAPATELPSTQPGGSSPFDPAAVELHMNNWLVNAINCQNEQRTEDYNLAMKGYQTTCAEYQRAGLPLPPPPPPPLLEKAEAMPPGWWFQVG